LIRGGVGLLLGLAKGAIGVRVSLVDALGELLVRLVGCGVD
jgi:hypothetical protein